MLLQKILSVFLIRINRLQEEIDKIKLIIQKQPRKAANPKHH